MSTPLTVNTDRVVLFDYVLTDDDGGVIDQSQPDAPMAYLHGHQNIVPGLERELVGATVGQELTVTVAPEDGYGIRREGVSQSVHRKEFPKDMQLQVGMPIRAEGSEGHPMILWVEKIEGARVGLTVNHPLAGKTLHFAVKIQGIREASAEEVAHGHVHGPEGHNH